MNGLGASLREGRTRFRVWAPRCRRVDLVLDGASPRPMAAEGDGTYMLSLENVAAGTRYTYRLDGKEDRPDPASRWQPVGVHGPSAVVDPSAFAWTDHGFRGHALADLVFYELHVGTFTPAGTFEAVIPYLPGLAELGVTAVELMPIAEFPGTRNWGYDGVHLYAPQSSYGGPRGLRRLVDACHANGLSVVLDVVYNHVGPEGNYLGEFGPYFTDRYKTPWGSAVNFDGPDSAPVRRHFIENAAYWAREFHIDGLRLDAIHAIFDASPTHVLTEIADAVRAEARRFGRPAHVIAESHDNDRRIVIPAAAGGLGLDAVWSDDFHHTLHVRLTGERGGYYMDFTDPEYLPRALAQGFAFQGQHAEYFDRPRGTPSDDLEGHHFVIFTQNHDQVGNRAQGDRLSAQVSFEATKLAAALMFVAPALPLIFMGEEYGETAPFQFFASFLDPEVAAAVRRGRADEFRRFAWQGTVPDPMDAATFERSRLDPSLAKTGRHRALRDYYRAWLQLRRSHPALGARGKRAAHATLDAGGTLLTVSRSAPTGSTLRLVANLTSDARPWRLPAGGRVVLDSADPRFGEAARPAAPLGPFQVLLFEATE